MSAEIQSLVYRGGCGDNDGTYVDGGNKRSEVNINSFMACTLTRISS